MAKLTELKVKNAKPGVYGDGGGLYLRVKDSGARSWVLRVQHMGKREDIGLGGYPLVTLAKARDKALELRRLARDGENARAARDVKRRTIPTFAEALKEAHEQLSKGWAEKQGLTFLTSLNTHIVPRIGAQRVDRIGTDQIISALSPIWTTKPETARKLRIRILQVLSYAKARGWRTEAPPSPSELRGGLSKLPKPKHFVAMPYPDVPAFVAKQLEKADSAGRLALLFTIVTAARSGEVRQACWNQIDIEARTWTRPAAIMKTRVEHVVTLNDAALALIERARPLAGKSGLVFPNSKDKPLSDMTLLKIVRDSGEDVTVHGFRSSFRVWAAETMPTIPEMVAEIALAHLVGTTTTRSYQRSDLRDLRRALMDGWGRFVAPSLSGVGDNVTPIRAGGAG